MQRSGYESERRLLEVIEQRELSNKRPEYSSRSASTTSARAIPSACYGPAVRLIRSMDLIASTTRWIGSGRSRNRGC